ncbi:hypothetical protein BpHYR1_053490 [Brachionus plicatilis]|uniref:Uncharacterized protein n=1 Tax=Brachionus plicatilis TaxID=10195 RepID=A0A3M7R4B2_BRAPC|nr:hypothetical protein BpHYR1_053490 [Brachionus plicatilis]
MFISIQICFLNLKLYAFLNYSHFPHVPNIYVLLSHKDLKISIKFEVKNWILGFQQNNVTIVFFLLKTSINIIY